jgi:two-component system phosphate regulon sensor histidine kinase PhoR
VTTPAGTIVHASRRAERLLASEVPVAGRRLASYVDRVSRASFGEAQRDAAPGSVVPVRLKPRRADPFEAVLTLCRRGDLFVWRLEVLEAPETLPPLPRLVESLSDAVLVVDPSLVVMAANRAARRLVGVAPGEPLSERWRGLDLRRFALALFASDAVHGEAHVEVPDASHAVTGLPSVDRELAVLVVADTSRRLLRERLEQEFVANAAHELQTPLTAIVGLVEALTEDAGRDPELRERFLAHLRRETERLVRLVDALLLLARAGELDQDEREVVPLAPLLRRLAEELTPEPEVDVRVRVPPDLSVRTHRGLLEAVLMNLSRNAARHTASGQIVLSARARRGGVVVEVRDTGPGMDAATRARAADRFFKGRGRRDGFGLGLAIASQAAEGLGGTLELDSWPGAGTIARLVLPQWAAP